LSGQEVKKLDLDVFISFGLILNGPLEDFIQERSLLQLAGARNRTSVILFEFG